MGLVPEGRGKWSGRTECRESGQQRGWLEAEQRLGLRPQLAKKPVSLVAQTVKNLPAMQEMQVQSLGQEDPLQGEMAIPWTEEPWDHRVRHS